LGRSLACGYPLWHHRRVNSKELVGRALQGLPVPRVPAGPLAVHFCARLAGFSLRAYSTQARVLAESVIRYYERFQPDAVWVSADTWVSAEAMGAAVGASGDDQPVGGMGAPLIRTAKDIDRLRPADVGRQGRYPFMLEALAGIVEALGRDVFVVACFDQYPFSLASALLGLPEAMLKLKEDQAMLMALMERCLEYGLTYARALGKAGADMLSGGDSPAGLIGPQLYREVAWPFEKRLISGLKESMDKPVSLHICGDATMLLPDMAQSGADVLEIDHLVNLAEACRRVGPGIALWGNLNPVGLLLQGQPEDVSEACRTVIGEAEASRHRRFVLSSGCTLALDTPETNLREMFQVASRSRLRG
jgi:uroporphyrinogen decarboxylase